MRWDPDKGSSPVLEDDLGNCFSGKPDRLRDILLDFTRRHDYLTLQNKRLQCVPQRRAAGIFLDDPCNNTASFGDQYVIPLLD